MPSLLCLICGQQLNRKVTAGNCSRIELLNILCLISSFILFIKKNVSRLLLEISIIIDSNFIILDNLILMFDMKISIYTKYKIIKSSHFIAFYFAFFCEKLVLRKQNSVLTFTCYLPSFDIYPLSTYSFDFYLLLI